MAKFVCEQCGAPFVRDRSGARPIRFCCGQCYQDFRAATGYNKASTFTRGTEPWNKGVKGLHLSPATEFKKGRVSLRHLPVGSIRVREDKNGKQRSHIKVAEPNKWELLAVVVYERAHGPVPAGMVVHHRDRDSLNDDINNLQAMTRAAHLSEHRAEIRLPRAERLHQPSIGTAAL